MARHMLIQIAVIARMSGISGLNAILRAKHAGGALVERCQQVENILGFPLESKQYGKK